MTDTLDSDTAALAKYSSCTETNGQRTCTSAPLSLECGEEAKVPSTTERLRCVRP